MGFAPFRTSAVFASPTSEAAAEPSQLLVRGLLLSAGYLLLPVDEFQVLAAQAAEAILTFSREEASGGLREGVQKGQVTSLGSLATYPGHPTTLTMRRAVPFLTPDEVPFPLHASGSATAFPIQSTLTLEVEPQTTGLDGRVTSRVRFEAEHLGRRLVFDATLPLDRTPTPIAGLLIQRTEELSVGPFVIDRNTHPRLAALAVTAEPVALGPAPSGEEADALSAEDAILPPLSRAPAVRPAAGRITATASLAPFVAEVVAWFGPLPDASEPSSADDTLGLVLARTAEQQLLTLDTSWRWADSARLTLSLESWNPAAGTKEGVAEGWIGLHGTLARRLELVGGAFLGPRPTRWYVGLSETTAPSSSLELRAAYLLQVSGGAFAEVTSGRLLSLGALDPAWEVAAGWHPGPWRLDLTLSRPPGDVDQVELRLARQLVSGEKPGLAPGLEAGVRYRWPVEELEYRLGLRFRTWE
ncbi:hypothetical protein [Limnochorda pilosa]|uniref:hypothetical protein n=1 Tax=Limnochorda pilosa TaxID=1555112 RepID=UPI00118761ED|nr:hypothetical protein [Limnochorda pilosa]